MEVASTKKPYAQTNGTSLLLGQHPRPESCRSPRPPPLISKFRGEPLPSPDKGNKQLARSRSGGKNDIISMHSSMRSSCAPYFIIHPEWASELNSVSRLDKNGSSCSPLPTTNKVTQVRRSAHRRRQMATPINEEDHFGILPADKGPEGILSIARRAAVCNPVWPHRCRSAPAQRAVNPITWV